MESPVVMIEQEGWDLGWGKLGAVAPGDGGEVEITLHDVQMGDRVEFKLEGPFKVVLEDRSYAGCSLVNYKRLRPACTYDRVILVTKEAPKAVHKSKNGNDN